MANNRSGLNDRRGFDGFIKLSLLLAAVGFVMMFVYSWKVGLATLLVTGFAFMTLDAVSSRPANGPIQFSRWIRMQSNRRPVLVCLGDSLTHGNCSASITPEIPHKLCQSLGMPLPKYGSTFTDPLWVVNFGQNLITSHTILNERLNKALNCRPDYIVLMIGTNDVLSMYSGMYSKMCTNVNELPEPPSMKNFERNLVGILDYIEQSSPLVQVGVCTLPPLGENLRSDANKLIREANAIVERVVSSNGGSKVSIVPVFQEMEAVLEKQKKSTSFPVELFFPLAIFQNLLMHNLGLFFTWNRLSSLVGYSVLSDGVHLNETGRDVVVDATVEWLLKRNVAKAIAVKS